MVGTNNERSAHLQSSYQTSSASYHCEVLRVEGAQSEAGCFYIRRHRSSTLECDEIELRCGYGATFGIFRRSIRVSDTLAVTRDTPR